MCCSTVGAAASRRNEEVASESVTATLVRKRQVCAAAASRRNEAGATESVTATRVMKRQVCDAAASRRNEEVAAQSVTATRVMKCQVCATVKAGNVSISSHATDSPTSTLCAALN